MRTRIYQAIEPTLPHSLRAVCNPNMHTHTPPPLPPPPPSPQRLVAPAPPPREDGRRHTWTFVLGVRQADHPQSGNNDM